MAKRKRRKKKKKDSTFWQWVVVALAALLLYKGLDYFLPRDQGEVKKSTSVSKEPSPSPEEGPSPIEKWTFESASQFLPKEGYRDNFNTIPLAKKDRALLSYAKKIPGKSPGHKGLVNTRPGLRYLFWDGKKYQTEDLSFSALEPSLGKLSSKNFVGLPRVGKKSIPVDQGEIFPTEIFLSNDDRSIIAYLMVSESGIAWAPLNHASGKKIPAAFVKGTTKETTQGIKNQKHDGKNYLILENGVLDEDRPYAGYKWNIQTYFWDGNNFVYDQEYSQELTRKKKLNP